MPTEADYCTPYTSASRQLMANSHQHELVVSLNWCPFFQMIFNYYSCSIRQQVASATTCLPTSRHNPISSGLLSREIHPVPSSCGQITLQSRSIHLELCRNILHRHFIRNQQRANRLQLLGAELLRPPTIAPSRTRRLKAGECGGA